MSGSLKSFHTEVLGDFAMFTQPYSRLGGNKVTYEVPTYGSLKAILENIYKKPTFTHVIDNVRVMNEIQYYWDTRKTFQVTAKPKNASQSIDRGLVRYRVLKNVKYRITSHIVWNEIQTNMDKDRNFNKHMAIFEHRLKGAPYRTPYFGMTNYRAFHQKFDPNDGELGFYSGKGIRELGRMFYAYAYSNEHPNMEKNTRVPCFVDNLKMVDGVITFPSFQDKDVSWMRLLAAKCPSKIYPDLKKDQHGTN